MLDFGVFFFLSAGLGDDPFVRHLSHENMFFCGVSPLDEATLFLECLPLNRAFRSLFLRDGGVLSISPCFASFYFFSC